MIRRVVIALACVAFMAPILGCQQREAKFDPASSRLFFPLVPNSTWTYEVKSKSQKANYVITDKVVGERYVPSLNVTGQVVEEYYNMDRGGIRPIVYVTKDGYWTRLSGLDYEKHDIEAPAWGRSEEGEFMPARLVPNLDWKSRIYPFGHIDGAFDIRQTHHTFFEGRAVVVPAGSFAGCIRIETQAVYEGGSYAKIGKPLRLTYEDYYAPKVGLIKTLALEGGTGGAEMERVELLRFTPASSKQASGLSQQAQAK